MEIRNTYIKLLLLFIFLSFASGIFAQVSKTVNLTTAGTLSTILSPDELGSVTNLTLTGTIDARDFKTMRNKMTLLAVINISDVTIAAYYGSGGTSSSLVGAKDYPANSIPTYAFYDIDAESSPGKTSLLSIVLPTSVTSIGIGAFKFCSGLTSIAIPSSVTTIEAGAFSGCWGLTTVTIPASVTSIGEGAFSYCRKLTSVTIPPSVTSMGAYAFAYCSKLTTFTIPSSVTSIEREVFRSCNDLTTVTIPPSVTSIGSGAFFECSKLADVTIPESVTSIGFSAFSGCTDLTIIVIPPSVTSIGESAFAYCSSLTNVKIPSLVTSIKASTFERCSGLTSVTIPHSVTSIGESAFYGCGSLTDVLIPSSVTSIGKDAFLECSGMITVNANNPNYSSIDGVLYNKDQTTLIKCPISKVGSFTIPPTVTIIGTYAFGFCGGLTSVTIPSTVTSIESFAFRDCTGLTSVTIPSSVTKIGKDAFYYCIGLTSITTSRLAPVELFYEVFYYVNKTTCTLYVPIGSKSAYQSAYKWQDFVNIVEKDITGIDFITIDRGMTIFPNPTFGKIKVVFDQIPHGGTTLIVNDFTGKTILTQYIQNREEYIDLGGNSPGIYLISTNTKDSKVQKVILK